MTDHDSLRRLAEQATPGPWELDALENGEHGLFINDDHPEAGTLGCASNQVAGFMVERNAEFIAAWNPATALNLLNELRDAKAKLADAWDEGFVRGHKEADSYTGLEGTELTPQDCSVPNPYREHAEPAPNERGIYKTNGVHSAKRTTPFTRTPKLSCRCEFGWAHDCPHHGNKETQ